MNWRRRRAIRKVVRLLERRLLEMDMRTVQEQDDIVCLMTQVQLDASLNLQDNTIDVDLSWVYSTLARLQESRELRGPHA